MFNQHKIKPLLNEIQLCNDGIEDSPEVPSFYYQKAAALTKLVSLTNDTSRLNEALENYNRAIEIDPSNALYPVDRANLYVKLAAISDVEKSKIYINFANSDIEAAKGLHSDGVEKIYIRNTIESTVKEINNINIKNNPQETNKSICNKSN